MPPVQLPEQQSRPVPHDAPALAQGDARHTPLAQEFPAQHSERSRHAAPAPTHDGARHTPPLQLIEQHCASAEHALPVLGHMS
jgi:hypothetical protein